MLACRRQERSDSIPRSFAIALAIAALARPGAALAAGEAASTGIALFDARGPLILGIVLGITAFAVTAAIGFLRATGRARSAEERAGANAERLEGELDVLHAILSAEPQTLVYWDQGQAPHLASDMLDPALNVPVKIEDLLDFGSWLPAKEAERLTRRTAALREMGEAFNLMLKTKSGAFVEIDGRAKGAGAVMKIRDLAGQRAELSRICAEHERLSNDIEAAKAMLDVLTVPAWLRDQTGRLKWVNRAYAKMVDATDANDACNRQVELFSKRQREKADAAISVGETYRGTLEARANGEERTFDVTLMPLNGSSAGIAVAQTGALDIDGALRAADDTHAKALNRIATAVATYDADQRLRFFNRAFAELWTLDEAWLNERPGYGEILDRLRADRMLPEQADYRAWKRKQISGETGETSGENFWHLPDGRTIKVLVDPGQGGGRTVLYEDVTERLTLESRYNSLIQVQKETLDNLQEGVVVFASDGRAKLFNRAFAKIWKLEPNALDRQPHIDELINQCRVLLDDDAAWEEVKTAVTGIDDERRSIEGELSRPDGSQLAYAGLPLPDGATLLTYVDITDAKRAERALIERNEALEAAGRLKGAFISHISYELRVPLTNIIGFSELLAAPAMGPLTEKQQDYLGDIRTSSDTLLAIIDDILDLATIDAGELELRRTDVDLRELVETAVLGVRDRIQAANLDLVIDLDGAPERFEADPRRVRQVLYNLLANAVDFSQEGGRVTFKAARDGDMVAFTVKDEGVGIAPADHEAVFERFERRSHGSRQGGAGLGLSLAKSLVELHGGEISLTSALGEGTAVTARLPISRAALGRGRRGDGAATAAA